MERDEKWLLNEKYGGAESEAFRADLKRLAAGEPLAYVIGYVPFLGCRISLDSRPLIPRAETEYWAEKAIRAIKKAGAASPRPLRLLDLCAGSGCVGVAVAKAAPMALVDFAEIDERHHPTIGQNLKENGIAADRTRIFGGDLWESIADQYDFILANPPYIDPSVDRTEKSVKAYEPHLALYGGSGGLEIIERIVMALPHYLAPGGQCWLEHEPEQSAAIKELASAAGLNRVETFPDQYGASRFSVIL